MQKIRAYLHGQILSELATLAGAGVLCRKRIAKAQIYSSAERVVSIASHKDCISRQSFGAHN